MTTKNASSKSKRERGPLFWVLVTLGIVSLCCIATMIVAWFTGDSIVEFIRPYLQ